MKANKPETKRHSNIPSITRVNTPKLKKHHFYSCGVSPSIDLNNNEIETRGDLKNIFDDSFKKIKNTLAILTKNGVTIEFLKNKFDLTPDEIIKYLNLEEPIYSQTTHYGHFGKNERYQT